MLSSFLLASVLLNSGLFPSLLIYSRDTLNFFHANLNLSCGVVRFAAFIFVELCLLFLTCVSSKSCVSDNISSTNASVIFQSVSPKLIAF